MILKDIINTSKTQIQTPLIIGACSRGSRVSFISTRKYQMHGIFGNKRSINRSEIVGYLLLFCNVARYPIYIPDLRDPKTRALYLKFLFDQY